MTGEVRRWLPWAVWVSCGAWSAWFGWAHSLSLPLLDEVHVPLTGIGDLLAPHYGHRVPLPKAALGVLFHLGGLGAMRLASWLCAWAGAAVAIRLATRLRGRAAWVDAAFPLLLSGPAYALSIVHAYDLCFTLPALLALMAACLLTHRREGWAAVCVVACLGCGVNGIALAVSLAACWPLRGDWRRGAVFALGTLAFGAALLVGAEGVDYPDNPLSDQLYTAARLALAVLDRVLSRWVWSAPPVLVFWLGAIAILARRRSVHRAALPLFAGLVGSLATWAAIAATRTLAPDEDAWVPARYQVLVALPYVFALLLLARRRARRATLPAALLTLALLVALPAALWHAGRIGGWVDHLEAETRIARASLWTPREIAEHYGEQLFPYDRDVLIRSLRVVLGR